MKANQGNLSKEIIDMFEKVKKPEFASFIHSVDTQVDKDHGRIESRQCVTIENLGWLFEIQQWEDARSIIKITANVFRKGKETVEERYYISSLPGNAALMNRAVRKHWYIENKLHWVLDVLTPPASPVWSAVSGVSTGWSTTGNSGTSASTNFIGTTDNVPLTFKVNNFLAGKIDHLLYNTSLGSIALYSNNSGVNNSALGAAALYNNTEGNANTANGISALFSNTTGSENTANGTTALFSNTTGYYNTAIGANAFYSNAANIRSTAIGYNAMFNADDRTTGQETFNTAVGFEALKGSDIPANNTGRYNTAIGDQSLYSNTTGNNNTAIGYLSLFSNTADENTAIGSWAMYSNLGGTRNTAVGNGALQDNEVGYNNTALGYIALNNNLAIDNTAIGTFSMYSNETGTSNVAVGIGTLQSNVDGINNTAIGAQSLTNNKAGENTAVGNWALQANLNGIANVAMGDHALQSNQEGSYNTAVGYYANVGTDNLTNASAIGYGATVNASHNMVFGNNQVVGWGFGVPPGSDAIKVGTSGSNGNGATLTLGGVWTDASDLSKKYDIGSIHYGINEIMKLHPVTYKLKGLNTQDIGFIAQEVKKIIPEIVYGEEGEMTLSYGQIAPVLVKAMQEQQKKIEMLEETIEEMKIMQAELVLRLRKIENK